jgi:DNA repair protein RadC
LKAYLWCKDREHFVVLHLDGAHRVVSAEVVSVGVLSAALVHPREVFKSAILANSAAIICAHNHPSGDLEPSDEDRRTFEKLSAAAELMGIPLLDFLIVARDSHWSATGGLGWSCL